MKIDYCSDTHWDLYADPSGANNFRKIELIINNDFSAQNSDTLIIAGDTGHYPKQDALFLTVLKERYKNIFIVQGNHNLYCVSRKQKDTYKTWQAKFDESKKIFEDCDCYVLDGDIVKLGNKTIGGAMGWYDGHFFYDQGFFNPYYGESLDSRWKRVMNDSRLIPGLKAFYDIMTVELPKLESVFLKEPDLMVSHFIPSVNPIAFHEKYRNDANNAFYSFSFDVHLLGATKETTWIYGHTHDIHEFSIGNVKCITNPFGYPSENPSHKVKTIEI